MEIQAQHKRRMLRRHQPQCYHPGGGGGGGGVACFGDFPVWYLGGGGVACFGDLPVWAKLTVLLPMEALDNA